MTLLILSLIAVAFGMMSLIAFLRLRGYRDQRELEQHSITADELHMLLASNQEVLLFDVRQPLDLLADSEIIPKAQRIPPDEVLQNHFVAGTGDIADPERKRHSCLLMEREVTLWA